MVSSPKSEPESCRRRSSRLANKIKDKKAHGHVLNWADSTALVLDDKPSVGLKLEGQPTVPAPLIFSRGDSNSAAASGLWSLLPDELIESVLKMCSATQLGMLGSTCTYFHRNRMIERIAKQKLKAVPRARGLKPCKKETETYLTLLHFINCQSAAAAQATAVACGAHHSAALLVPSSDANNANARHALYTFGRGFHGQLGNSSYTDSQTPAPICLGFRPCQDNPEVEEETMPAVVACGAHYSASISRRGELFSWGLGSSGELGQGRWTAIEQPLPRQCSLPQIRIVSVACGAYHTLAIAENGSLWSCGKNRSGQLGVGNLVDGPRLQLVQNLSGYRIVTAAAGVQHSLALASDGSFFTWGEGSQGQLGHVQLQQLAPAVGSVAMSLPQKILKLDPNKLAPHDRVTAVAAGSYHSMAMTVGGSILAFGSNSHGELGTGDLSNRWKPCVVKLAREGEEHLCLRAVQVVCGAVHTVALVSNQGCLEVRSTGCNSWGQLGHGDRTNRLSFTPTSAIPNVIAVQAGDEHSAAISCNGDLYMWGRGDSGQLGLGDNRAKWRPTLVKTFKVVHPERTLRRNKRTQPYTRPLAQDSKRPRLADLVHIM